MKPTWSHNINDLVSTVEANVQLPPKNRLLRLSSMWLVILAVLSIATAGWAINHFYLKPLQDDRLVARELQKMESDVGGERDTTELRRRLGTDRIVETFELLMPRPRDIGDVDRIDGYLAALRIARRSGLPEAKLAYGKALRDGLIGERDSTSALKVFDELNREIDRDLRAGDPVAMYISALIIQDGLGKPIDTKRAAELASLAAPRLDGWRLEKVALSLTHKKDIFKDIEDPDSKLATQLGDRMIAQKMVNGPKVGITSCKEEVFRKQISCEREWYRRAVQADIGASIPVLATYLLRSGDPLDKVERMFARGNDFSHSYHRFQHGVVKAVLAKNDLKFIEALSEMWKQAQAGSASARKFDFEGARKYGFSDADIANRLSRNQFNISFGGTFVAFADFDAFLDGHPPSLQLDSFLVAVNVYDLLNGAAESYGDFSRSPKRTDLLARAKTPEIMRISQIAAQAIRNGVPLTEVKLGMHEKVAITIEAAPVDLSKYASGSLPQSKAASVPAVTKDAEQQDKTGYLKGQPRAAIGGLSSFTVDNRKGGKDAVARIYLNGQKPAVRSMYVKQGETFKAETILPGTYVFRYRFIGSEDTFEADKEFPLTQTVTKTGMNYSKVTVTLFTVTDGNMQTRKVDPNSF